MKTTILTALFGMLSLSAFADDYTLYVETSTAMLSYDFNDLQRITFNDGQMVIATKSGEANSVDISTINRVYFDSEATGIEEKDVIKQQDGETAIYDLAGRKGSDLQNLPNGIYVVKEGGKTRKIVKK